MGGFDLGFLFLPYYRVWVIVLLAIICLGTWFLIERTRMGAISAPRPRIPSWSRRSASTCRAW